MMANISIYILPNIFKICRKFYYTFKKYFYLLNLFLEKIKFSISVNDFSSELTTVNIIAALKKP